MPNLVATMEKLGLTDKQAKVYLAALELGGGTVQEMARKSGLKRTHIYNLLDDLGRKGFLSQVEKDGRAIVIPEKPELIVERAKNLAKEAENALPDLLGIFNLPPEKTKVRYYQGYEGIKKIYADAIKEGRPIYGFSDFSKMLSTDLAQFAWDWMEDRINANLPFYIIAKDDKDARAARKKDKKQLREMRLIKNVSFETEILIFGDKVAMASLRHPGAGVIIEDKAIAQTQKSLWQALWDSLK